MGIVVLSIKSAVFLYCRSFLFLKDLFFFPDYFLKDKTQCLEWHVHVMAANTMNPDQTDPLQSDLGP